MNEVSEKPVCSISLDLDNLWSYMKIHGDSGWEKFPSYLNSFIPKVLELLNELNLKITFFIVGQDAALDKNKEFISAIVRKGHELGNHSFSHESWLNRSPKNKIKDEIFSAEEHIRKISGEKTKGFRGPGFCWSKSIMEVLAELEYEYDASSLPTFIGPLARFYYFKTAKLSKAEKEERKNLFGNFKDGFMPVKSYLLNVNGNKRVLEIPVTTIPFLRTPFHLSYLIYLNGISPSIMKQYLHTAVKLCKRSKINPSFLLHPLDLFSGDTIPELKFFPGMNLNSQRKKDVFTYVISFLSKNFTIVNMGTHAQLLKNEFEPKIVDQVIS